MLNRIKLAYSLYNFFNQKKLTHFKVLNKKYNTSINPILPLSHKDFKNIDLPKSWLDKEASEEAIKNQIGFDSFSKNIQDKILNWKRDGFMVLNDFFSEEEIDIVNKEVNRLQSENKIHLEKENDRATFAFKHSNEIRKIATKPELINILSFLLGAKVTLFQTLNFIYGTQQRAHSDSVHMTTHPLGYMIAAWMPLEDISEDSGPLFYYPGSHKLPYVLKSDFNHGGNKFLIGKQCNRMYENKIEEVINEHQLTPVIFTPKKGDILIWHANLLHGGSERTNPKKTRKSMVMHYFCKDAYCYHEITERAALMD